MSDFPIVLGITYGGHDSSACLTVGGRLVAACEEERYNRKKHTQEFPTLAISECLKKAKIEINDVDIIKVGDNILSYENFALYNTYNFNVVPKLIFQTWPTKKLPRNINPITG